jgi:hypothetical protein
LSAIAFSEPDRDALLCARIHQRNGSFFLVDPLVSLDTALVAVPGKPVTGDTIYAGW